MFFFLMYNHVNFIVSMLKLCHSDRQEKFELICFCNVILLAKNYEVIGPLTLWGPQQIC